MPSKTKEIVIPGEYGNFFCIVDYEHNEVTIRDPYGEIFCSKEILNQLLSFLNENKL